MYVFINLWSLVMNLSLLDLARTAHIMVGVAALATFWSAALATKGGNPHRRMGRYYVFSMSALLSLSLVMAAGMVAAGQGMRAVFNVYVALISICSVWMSWRSIRARHDVDAYRGLTCKLLCVVMGLYGSFLLVMAPKMDIPARVVMAAAFALLGLAISAWLARRIWLGADHPRWWLSEHLTGMALNFGATHASFSILGLGLWLPAVKEPWSRTTILVGWILAALVLRVWAGRRFLGSGRRFEERTLAGGSVAG